jgi:hypothetical protein
VLARGRLAAEVSRLANDVRRRSHDAVFYVRMPSFSDSYDALLMTVEMCPGAGTTAKCIEPMPCTVADPAHTERPTASVGSWSSTT